MSHTLIHIGNYKVFEESCTSTNNALKQLLVSTDLPNGTLYYTKFQTQGRGQQENTWESNANQNALISIYLKPTFLKTNDQPFLNMAVSLATMEALQYWIKPKVSIKWPNDIICDDKKLAGILLENVISAQHVKYSICGIGINVNQTEFNITHATAIKLLTGVWVEPMEVINRVSQTLEKYYLWLHLKQFDKILNEYNAHLYTKGISRTFKIKDQKILGEIIGVNSAGKLLVMIDDEINSFANKEIEFVY